MGSGIGIAFGIVAKRRKKISNESDTMSTQRMLAAGLALAAFIVLGIVFMFLPAGWNLLPLLLVVPVIVFLALQWKGIRCAWGNEPERSTGAEANDDGSAKAASDQRTAPELVRRLNRVFGPIAAGMVIDLVDFATFGPVGLVLGFPIGGLAGYWMGRALGLSRRGSVWCALACGIYCTIPGTEFIPLATIVGACVRFQDKRNNAGP